MYIKAVIIISKSVGYNIKKWRNEKKINQTEMAKKLGISRSYLANLEAGRKNVGEATIKNMSDKSGISTYYLTTGEKLSSDVRAKRAFDRMNEDSQIQLAQDLAEITEVKLSFVELTYLRNALNFIEADSQDIETMAVILRRLDQNYNAWQNEPDKEAVEEDIEDMINEFSDLVKRRYGYEGD